MDWNKRKEIKTTAHAVEALADFLSSSGGIHSAIKNELDEAEAIANKWDVPFDRKLVQSMILKMNHKRWNGDTDSEAEMLEVYRSDYSSNKDYQDALAVARENYERDYYDEPVGDHTWMSSSETAQC